MSVHQEKEKQRKKIQCTDDIVACKIVMNQMEKITKTRDAICINLQDLDETY